MSRNLPLKKIFMRWDEIFHLFPHLKNIQHYLPILLITLFSEVTDIDQDNWSITHYNQLSREQGGYFEECPLIRISLLFSHYLIHVVHFTRISQMHFCVFLLANYIWRCTSLKFANMMRLILLKCVVKFFDLWLTAVSLCLEGRYFETA